MSDTQIAEWFFREMALAEKFPEEAQAEAAFSVDKEWLVCMWSQNANGERFYIGDFHNIHQTIWNVKLGKGELPAGLQKPLHLLAPMFAPRQNEMVNASVPNVVRCYELKSGHYIHTAYIELITVEQGTQFTQDNITELFDLIRGKQRDFIGKTMTALNITREQASYGCQVLLNEARSYIMYTISYAKSDIEVPKLTRQERDADHKIIWNAKLQVGQLSHIPEELRVSYEQLNQQAGP